MPRILTLDAALPLCSAAVVDDGHLTHSVTTSDSATLPQLVESLLTASPLPLAGEGWVRVGVPSSDGLSVEGPRPLDLIAVTIGPGSFTGLRAAIALAHGIAIGRGIPVVGITLGAAFAAAAPPGRTLWTAIDNKRGKIFLERGDTVVTIALDALPEAHGPIAVAGNAAIAVAARLAAHGADTCLLDARAPTPLGIARAATLGMTRPPRPLYIDPPQAAVGPAGRPPPA